MKTFWPENTDNKLYIAASTTHTIFELTTAAEEYFGEGIETGRVEVEVENIHTNAITYDLHDPTDWTLFYVLTCEEGRYIEEEEE